jgi:Virulence factor
VARYRILAWEGIPAQLKVEADGERRLSVALPDWFMQEIDRVAMREGLIGSDEYLERWAWGEWREREGSADEVAAAVVAELEAEWRPRPGPE